MKTTILKDINIRLIRVITANRMAGFPIFRSLIFMFGLLLAGLGIHMVGLDFSGRAILQLASRLEAGVVPDAESVAAMPRMVSDTRLSCRRDLQRARLTVDLAVLDHQLQDPSAGESTETAYLRALEDFSTELSCFPLDGNAWLRLAMAKLRFEGPGAKVIAMSRLSQWMMPYEGWVVQARLPFLAALSQTRALEADQLLNSDVDTLLRYAPSSTLRQVSHSIGAYGLERFRSRLTGLDAKRAEMAVKALGIDQQ